MCVMVHFNVSVFEVFNIIYFQTVVDISSYSCFSCSSWSNRLLTASDKGSVQVHNLFLILYLFSHLFLRSISPMSTLSPENTPRPMLPSLLVDL